MSQVPILHTKLHIPSIRPDLVSRRRLIRRLDAGRDRKLTLLSAPAGFGKTTLLGEWVAQSADRAAWLSLDKEDNDQVRFWTYLIASLRTLQAGLGYDALQLLQAPQPPAMHVILTRLLNQVTALPRRVILVLDDYHLISDPAIHEGIAFLLEHGPHNLHLVISTRADPPLPIFRLRARDHLTELRSADLRFTASEAAAFLAAVMGLDLAQEDVEALEARTEGWIVGLQLAALSLQGRTDAHEFITAFSGGHHYVLEYLTHEVVHRQPEPVQHFLMQTSILDSLCGPLCNALTGQSDGKAMLAHLRQRNLFIVPLDDEHRWFRYHHLFADLLRNLLRMASPPASIRALHLRACEWYAHHGSTAEAVSHALAAGDYDRAAQLIEDHSLAMVTRGEMTTLLHWIKALPPDVAHSRPWLCIHQAWPLTLAGRADAAEPLLQEIERQVSLGDLAPGGQEILGNVAAMRAMMALMRGDMLRAVELARRADELLPPDNLIPRHTIPFVLAGAYSAEGELAKARQAMAEELQYGQAAGNVWTIVRTLSDLADLHIIQGQLGRATGLCHDALQQAEERGARQFGTVGYALVKLGEIGYERHDLLAARDHVSEGIRLMQGWQQPYEMVSAYTTLALILQALSDAKGAREALQHAETIQSGHPSYPRLNSLVHGCRIRLCLAQDGPEEAARQATAARLGESGLPISREWERIILARLLVARQRWDEALALLARLERDSEAGGRFGRLIEILVLQALARQAQGDAAGALAALERALALGEPEGYVRLFLEAGDPLRLLISDFRFRIEGQSPDSDDQTRRRLLAYVDRLLGAFSGALPGRMIHPIENRQSRIQNPLEPLTPRELEVLRLICSGLSNREIAACLTVTLNTVKKHSSHIYGKLGVSSRAQAIVRAQEIGLC